MQTKPVKFAQRYQVRNGFVDNLAGLSPGGFRTGKRLSPLAGGWLREIGHLKIPKIVRPIAEIVVME
jgi:hypothetical protein